MHINNTNWESHYVQEPENKVWHYNEYIFFYEAEPFVFSSSVQCVDHIAKLPLNVM